jgi:hypothetical protein
VAKRKEGIVLSAEEYEQARTVAEDLEHLRDVWKPEVSEAQLRRESPTLRRLLVDGAYPNAWRRVGLPREPMVIASDLKSLMGTVELSRIGLAIAPLPFDLPLDLAGKRQHVYAFTRDAPEHSLIMPVANQRGAFMTIFASPEENAAEGEALAARLAAQVGSAQTAVFWLSEYLASPAIFMEGQWFGRRTILKYVANRLGGVHFGAGKGDDAKRFEALDRVQGLVGSLPITHSEMLGIGWNLASTTDAARFIAEFKSLPEPEHRIGRPTRNAGS